jgi:adenylate cyclase
MAREMAVGNLNGKTHFLALLIECALRRRRLEVAEAILEVARGLIRDLGERHVAPEIDRLSGELRQAKAQRGLAVGVTAENFFRQALTIAEEQGSCFLALRAATSLAELLRQRGDGVEARALLAPRLEEIVEGLDTPDVYEAKELLQALPV